jgi:hypothetical protein
MKRHIAALILCLAIPALAATDDGSLACRMVDRSLIERLSGKTVGALESQAMDMCAGLCPSLNASLCRVSILGAPSSGNEWTIWVYQPPFQPGDWLSQFDEQAQRKMVTWRGAQAVWDYRADQERGILTVWTNDHSVMIMVAQEHGARQEGVSLSAARAIASRALVLFKNQK